MKKYWKSSIAALAALAAAATVQAAGTPTTIIDFEQVVAAAPDAPFMPLLAHGDEFTQAGYWFDTFSNQAGAQAGDLVGALIDGAKIGDICGSSVACPSGNTSTFYGGLNDGVLGMGRLDGSLFRLTSLDVGFLGAVTPDGFGNYAPLVLQLQGLRANNSWLTTSLVLPAPVNGSFSFSSVVLPSIFQSTAFQQVFFYGMPCDSSGNCAGFNSDKGQFALDNVAVTAVPEPSQYALLAAGLVVVGAIHRRRKA